MGMNVFTRMRDALGRFMLGRNGLDALNQALLWGTIGLYVLRFLCALVFRSFALDRILGALYTVLLVLLVFRALSRNLPRRQMENQKWLSLWGRWNGRLWRLRARGSGILARRADKEHRYFTCKNCKTVCRVPAGKGKIVITCPKCGAKIQAKT